MDDLGEGDAGAQTFTVEAERVRAQHTRFKKTERSGGHASTHAAASVFSRRSSARRSDALSLILSTGRM